jgi:hypothetical protein
LQRRVKQILQEMYNPESAKGEGQNKRRAEREDDSFVLSGKKDGSSRDSISIKSNQEGSDVVTVKGGKGGFGHNENGTSESEYDQYGNPVQRGSSKKGAYGTGKGYKGRYGKTEDGAAEEYNAEEDDFDESDLTPEEVIEIAEMLSITEPEVDALPEEEKTQLKRQIRSRKKRLQDSSDPRFNSSGENQENRTQDSSTETEEDKKALSEMDGFTPDELREIAEAAQAAQDQRTARLAERKLREKEQSANSRPSDDNSLDDAFARSVEIPDELKDDPSLPPEERERRKLEREALVAAARKSQMHLQKGLKSKQRKQEYEESKNKKSRTGVTRGGPEELSQENTDDDESLADALKEAIRKKNSDDANQLREMAPEDLQKEMEAALAAEDALSTSDEVDGSAVGEVASNDLFQDQSAELEAAAKLDDETNGESESEGANSAAPVEDDGFLNMDAQTPDGITSDSLDDSEIAGSVATSGSQSNSNPGDPSSQPSGYVSPADIHREKEGKDPLYSGKTTFDVIVKEALIAACAPAETTLFVLSSAERALVIEVKSENSVTNGHMCFVHSGSESENKNFYERFLTEFEKRKDRVLDPVAFSTADCCTLVNRIGESETKSGPDFYFQTKTGSSEVAMKFLSSSPLSVGIEKFSDGKSKINLAEFPVGVPMRQDIFLYLNENQKHILYLKKNSILTAKQKEKLMKFSGVLLINESEHATFMEVVAIHRAINSLAVPPVAKAA